MFLKSLKLHNFRNYADEEFSFGRGINILTGANAQGKTNAAEAVFFLCTGYSPRAGKDRQVIKNGEDEAYISGKALSVYGEVSVGIRFGSEGKTVTVNGMKISRMGDLMGNIDSVFFNPRELKLVQESPEDRRRFLNISLSQMNKAYFFALLRYNKILSQRNNLLKNPDVALVKDTLPVWDEQLTRQAAKIIRARNEFISELSPLAEEKHAFITGGKESLSIKSDGGYEGSEEDIASAMFYDLKAHAEKDVKLGFTSIGPHRDDLGFSLNGTDVKIYGSQGQQRTVALSLKLAETEIFKKRTGEYPVLILDDVLSELDKTRKRKLVSAVEHLQTIFTSTELDRTIFKNKTFSRTVIENGKIKR